MTGGKNKPMSVKPIYKTVLSESHTTLIEKKSKFIAHVRPADNERAAIDFINEIRAQYPDATHNVYAYVIDENNIFRYSDDGEPSGTAGMPVLDAIRKPGIVDAAVVVTRYFGGTLLGTGGLVHTYGAAASQGLSAAGIITRTLCDVLSVKTDYTLSGKLSHMIASGGIILEDTVYAENVEFILCSPIDETERLVGELCDVTNGRAETAVTGRKYVNKADEQPDRL